MAIKRPQYGIITNADHFWAIQHLATAHYRSIYTGAVFLGFWLRHVTLQGCKLRLSCASGKVCSSLLKDLEYHGKL